MNTQQLTLAGMLLACLSSITSYGQETKLKKDVTYSTHNYKHPNKAAQAQKWEQNRGVAVTTPNPRLVVQDNYKHPLPGALPSGGITVQHEPSATITDRHYKTTNWLANPPKSEVAKKQKPNQDADLPNIGN